jgi:hypothetical protein
MSSVYEYAQRKGWTNRNPFRGVRRKPEAPVTDYVEHETLVHTLDTAPAELVPPYAIAYLLGIRQTDLRLAKVEAIKSNGLHVVESKTDKRNLHEITSTVRHFLQMAVNHKEAVAVRYEQSAQRLKDNGQYRRAEERLRRARELREQPYIFPSSRGRHWTEWALQSALRRFKPAFAFRQLRPKGQTDSPDANILGHTGQMRERYTRHRHLKAVK